MFDDTSKTWFILLIAFVGGSFEVFKHIPVKESVSWEAENLHYGQDGKPYAVHVLPHTTLAQPKPKAVHIAASQDKVLQNEMNKFVAATQPQKTEAADKNAAAAKKKKKEHNPEDWEIVTDPKTGKRMWHRKKKAEAKKEDPKANDPAVQPSKLAHNPDENPDTNAAIIAAAVSEAADTGVLPAPGPVKTGAFATLQEWEAILLKKPDAAATTRFIQDYKNHTVAPDVFFKITQMMIADPRPEMKQLGVMCAGAAPSVTSFQILASVMKSGSADLQAKAKGFLQQYGSGTNLSILRSVLQSSDTNVAMQAASVLDTAVQTYKPPTTGNPSTQSTSAARFQPFVPILNQLTQSHDAGLANQAQTTLQHLNGLLSGSGTAIAQTP